MRVVLGSDAVPVVGFELGGQDKSELGVKALVVEPVDVGAATAISTSATFFQPPLGRMTGLRMHSALSSEFSASAIALSYKSPPLPTDATASASASRSV